MFDAKTSASLTKEGKEIATDWFNLLTEAKDLGQAMAHLQVLRVAGTYLLALIAFNQKMNKIIEAPEFAELVRKKIIEEEADLTTSFEKQKAEGKVSYHCVDKNSEVIN